MVLGYHVATFTQASTEMAASVSTLGKTISTIRQDAKNIHLSVEEVEKSMAAIELQANSLSLSVTNGSTSASIQLVSQNEEGEPENVGSPVTIQMNGLVTFTGLADGTTSINGGCIKTGYISADRIQAGTITLSKLSTDVQNSMGGLDEDEVTTLITAELVSSPTIKGGTIKGATFSDLNGNLSLDISDPLGHGYYGLMLKEDSTNWFSIYTSQYGASLDMLGGPIFEVYNADNGGKIMPRGTWDFRYCTVLGL